jgi:hypothetical protein
MAVQVALPPFVHSRSVEPRSVEPSLAVPAVDPAFEERWAAWRARGLRHEDVVQSRIRLIALIVVLAVGLLVLEFVIGAGAR